MTASFPLHIAQLEGLTRELGGKGAQLVFLTSHSLPVPAFRVIPADRCSELKNNPSRARERIETLLSDLPTGDFAVRSSMIGEDSQTQSFAGILETHLHVSRENLFQKIEECIRSSSSDRIKAYQNEKSNAQPRMAVVVQVMIPSEKSGVAFSRAPTGNSARILIDASWGLGEGIVAGKVPVDHYVLDRFAKPLSQVIADKATSLHLSAKTSRVEETPVSAELRHSPCLTTPEQIQIAREVLRIETLYGCPVDIEWAFHQGQLWILQSRPITQTFPPLDYYSDTNLAESYPGITSPMTASFVKKMYTRVFRETGRFLGASENRLNTLEPHYQNLIQEFDGHLYYHLNSYYSAISAMPGGKKNLEAWHQMVGGTPLPIETQLHQPLHWLEWGRMGLRLVSLLLNHRRHFERFNSRQDALLLKLQQQLKNCNQSSEVAQLICDATETIQDWALPTFNDVLVMKFTEAFSQELAKLGLPPHSLSQWIRTEEGVESLLPLNGLQHLAQRVGQSPEIREALREVADNPELKRVKGSERFFLYSDQGIPSDFIRELESYLTRFGDRSFEELKLESETFRENPTQFLRIVAGYSLKTQSDKPTSSTPDKFSQTELPQLSLRARFFLSWVQRTIEARESSRLRRGRFYGWMRESLARFSELLRSETESSHSEISFEERYALRLEDLEEYSRHQISAATLRDRMKERKDWRSNGELRHPEYLSHSRGDQGPPTYRSDQNPDSSTPAYAQCDHLLGLGAAPGKTEGRALVLERPEDAVLVEDLENCILVTQSTDPAWIFLMARARGLISERGSLLSHTAIVGRELRIPTIVGVPHATRIIPKGAHLNLNGETGEIKITRKIVSE